MESLRIKAIRAAANQHEMVQRFGRVQTLELEPQERRINASLLLKGEAEPIQVALRYSIHSEASGDFLDLHDWEFSREWLQQIFGILSEQKRIPRIPLQGTLGTIIRMIL